MVQSMNMQTMCTYARGEQWNCTFYTKELERSPFTLLRVLPLCLDVSPGRTSC